MTSGRPGIGLPELAAERYRPIEPVGRGAIAEVVKARDEATGEVVALKILYPHLRENAAVAERFKREVEIVRRIAHPHVLAIRDVVEVSGDGGPLFLVMDYHPGGDLADRIARRGRLPADELRLLGAQLCGALGAAHRAGVVHRDVKPSNVLCGAGDALDVRLCDFGLARTSELSGLTTANAVLGTPEYMAPEVICEGHADPRSDVYSLGVVLFEAATGRLPFHGDSPYQLMRQHVDVEAPRASTLAEGVPPAIDRAIARALAKDPLDRFARAEDFARALAPLPGTSDPSPPPAHPARAPVASAAMARRPCPRCGGWLVERAATCADCGAKTLRLDTGSAAVLVTGPGAIADKLDAWRHVVLYKLLEAIPGVSLRGKTGRRAAPRVPFYVAAGVSPESGEALAMRLRGLGFEAKVVARRSWWHDRMWKKIERITWRYLAGVGVTVQAMNLLPRLGRVFFGVLMGGIGVFTAAAFGDTTFRTTRPLVALGARRGHAAGAAARLGDTLAAVPSRQDRRLLGRIVERLEQLQALGHAETTSALAEHAARAAEGLGALESRRQQGASVSTEPSAALAELRREERVCDVLRGHLLRVASRLEDLSLAVTRLAAEASRGEAGPMVAELGELTLDVDAREELARLLEETR